MHSDQATDADNCVRDAHGTFPAAALTSLSGQECSAARVTTSVVAYATFPDPAMYFVLRPGPPTDARGEPPAHAHGCGQSS